MSRDNTNTDDVYIGYTCVYNIRRLFIIISTMLLYIQAIPVLRVIIFFYSKSNSILSAFYFFSHIVETAPIIIIYILYSDDDSKNDQTYSGYRV